ncbi:selenophosphate synthetase [Lucifera butyrica]|uniref:Selenide, water dikinase n=2 Tax=Lucifera butyrica TaxID=1351585 RepID=A0A498R4A2_9FIRM|nr:selenophosphate synthetase [Lucifera butyrica]
MGPGALTKVLRQLPQMKDPKLIVGIDTSDDAGVYKLNDETALIQTVDFFPPIVDDPYQFGQIAAANSLSDVYAMGGRPVTAMNLVAFPVCRLPGEVLLEILRGGQAKVMEAGAVIAGGHTIEDSEPKYGLSVTGLVHPDKVWTNAGAREGDGLILTKAIGTGVLTTAARADMFAEGVTAAVESMKTLNRKAAEILQSFTVHACTDVTGFSLMGHMHEMAMASGLAAEVDSQALPFLTEARDAASMGLIPAGAYRNREHFAMVNINSEVPENVIDLCFDPQTSGGLLASLPQQEIAAALDALQQAGVTAASCIGRMKTAGRGEIHVY